MKKDPKIQKWGKSIIKRMDKFHNYLHDRLGKLTKEKVGDPERLLILEYKNLLRDIQQYIEMDL